MVQLKGVLAVGERDLSTARYHEYLEAGVHFLPAGRLEEGLISGLTITEHFLLAAKAKGLRIDWGAAEADAEKRIAANLIVGTPASTADELSGGNQQRLLLALMPADVRLLLMEHPTRGLDLESADWVWRQLLERSRRGTAIVFASADLDELLRYSDRILVFFAGSAKSGGRYQWGGTRLPDRRKVARDRSPSCAGSPECSSWYRPGAGVLRSRPTLLRWRPCA
jgi:simple sugar transport system ATP-binding protein